MIIKFKISAEQFNSILKDEMEQTIKYCGKDYSLFEYVLETKVGRIRWVKEWEVIEGFYYFEARFYSNMVLHKIKKLTLTHELLRNCNVSLYMTTSDKYGYFQIVNGFTSVGFCIKDSKWFYDKLIHDFTNIKSLGDNFNINLKQTIKSNGNPP